MYKLLLIPPFRVLFIRDNKIIGKSSLTSELFIFLCYNINWIFVCFFIKLKEIFYE